MQYTYTYKAHNVISRHFSKNQGKCPQSKSTTSNLFDVKGKRPGQIFLYILPEENINYDGYCINKKKKVVSV